MRTTSLVFISLCALLLQSFGLEEDMLVEPALDSIDALSESTEGFVDATVKDDATAEKTDGIELHLEMPLAKSDQTITESSEIADRTTDDIISDYNFAKISKSISEELDPGNQQQVGNWTETERRLRDALVSFIIEAAFTSLVLTVVCLLLGTTDAYLRIVSCGFIIAFIGAALGFALGIEALNPARLVLSFLILVPLVRWLVGVSKWPKVILISVITRAVSLVLIWGAYFGVSTLLGL